MRLRNKSIPTGRAITFVSGEERRSNRSIMFLIQGAKDIETLTRIDKVCGELIKARAAGRFEWSNVADQHNISTGDSQVDAGQITRFETREFSDLEPDDLACLLGPALDALAGNDPELFPHAGGAVGAPAEGIQFLNRGRELETISQHIQARTDLVLLAPRRSGKTSLLRRLETTLPPDYRTLYWDLQRHHTPENSAARLRVIATGEGFRSASRLAKENWAEVCRDSLRHLATGTQSEREARLVLLIDELVFLLDDLWRPADEESSKNAIMNYLHVMDVAIEGLDLGLVIAGSIDFFAFFAERDIELSDLPPRFQDLQPYHLPSLASQDPTLELRRLFLGTGIVIESGELDWFLENVDLAVPYPALCFLDGLSSTLLSAGSMDTGSLDQAYREFLDGTDAFREFEKHLHRRAGNAPGSETAMADALDLVADANIESGARVEAIRSTLEAAVGDKHAEAMAWLIATFPLAQRGDRVVFESKMFRSWWRRMGHTE